MVGNGAVEHPSTELRDEPGGEAIKRDDVRLNVQEARIQQAEEDANKVYQQGLNSASNTVVVVAALIATVTFAGIISPPGGLQPSGDEMGAAVLVHTLSFQIFFIFDALALFTSLAAVLSLVSWVPSRWRTSTDLWQTNMKVIWAASIFTLIAFLAAAYIVAGPSFRHLAWGLIAAGIASLVTAFSVMLTCCLYRRKTDIQKAWTGYKRGVKGSKTQLFRAFCVPGALTPQE